MKKRDRRYWRNLVAFSLGVLSVMLVVGIAYSSYISTDKYLHPRIGSREKPETPDAYGIAFDDIQLLTSDGIELAAWYTPSENGALILIAHGHGDRRSVKHYVMYAQNGYGVLAWDFRAHGTSGGELSTVGYSEALDVDAALEYGLEQANVEHIGAWGGSMGGVAVLECASRRAEIEAIVIDSVFPTLEDEMRWTVRNSIFLPFVRFFAEMETGIAIGMLRPVDRIMEISPRPVMIIQGDADNMIPPDSAQQLYEAAGEPRYLWTEAKVHHVGMYSEYPEKYEKIVVGFFDEYLLQVNE